MKTLIIIKFLFTLYLKESITYRLSAGDDYYSNEGDEEVFHVCCFLNADSRTDFSSQLGHYL